MSGYLDFNGKHKAVKDIASSLNRAGTAYHNTSEWDEGEEYDEKGRSYNEQIQDTLNAADVALAEKDAAISELVEAFEDISLDNEQQRIALPVHTKLKIDDLIAKYKKD